MITPSDQKWLKEKAMPAFGIRKLSLGFSSSDGKWPDIWCETRPPKITITREWARQNKDNRRIRLTHECIHLGWGLEHGKIDGLDFNTKPELDSYSKMVYGRIR